MSRLITSARRSTDSLDELPCSALRRTNARNLLAHVIELRYIPRHEHLLSVYRLLRQVAQGSFLGNYKPTELPSDGDLEISWIDRLGC